VIEAAALQRVVDLARAVGGDDDDRRMRGLDRAELGIVTWKSASTSSRNASKASSVRSSSSISSTGAPSVVGLQRLQQRPLDQEALGEDVVLEPLAVRFALGLGEADRDHLRGVVPLVDGEATSSPS
jgi:hypothetical protein